jgi:hypothetical protein
MKTSEDLVSKLPQDHLLYSTTESLAKNLCLRGLRFLIISNGHKYSSTNHPITVELLKLSGDFSASLNYPVRARSACNFLTSALSI